MSRTEDIPFFVLTVWCPVSYILNGTFVIVICKNWTLLKRRRITYHVTSLAISDFLVGANVFCRYIAIIATWKITRLSSVFLIIQYMAVLTSLLAVCLMAIERSLCIKKPITWKKIISLNRILRIMVGNWVPVLPLGILLYFYTFQMTIILAVFFYTFQSLSLHCVHQYVRKDLEINVVDDGIQQSSSIGERLKKLMQQKVANLVLILTLVLIITIAPTLLVIVIRESCILLNGKFIGTMKTVVTYSKILSMLNFIVNPILYVWRINLYRQAFWKMLSRGRNEN